MQKYLRYSDDGVVSYDQLVSCDKVVRYVEQENRAAKRGKMEVVAHLLDLTKITLCWADSAEITTGFLDSLQEFLVNENPLSRVFDVGTELENCGGKSNV